MTELIELSPTRAYRLLTKQADNSILIDIRTSMEFLFVGHPVGAVHIAWIDEPDWEINPDFEAEIHRLITARFSVRRPYTTKVILCCRSGRRSREAATVLLKAGYQQVFHITEGFEGERDENDHRSTLGGWRFCGLPWEQC